MICSPYFESFELKSSLVYLIFSHNGIVVGFEKSKPVRCIIRELRQL